MKFNGSILIATFFNIIIFFFISIALYASNESGFNFLEILTEQSIIIIGLLLGGCTLAFILGKEEQSPIKERKTNNLDKEISKISHEMIFLTQPFKARLEHTVNNIKDVLGCEAICVGIYEQNQIQILHQESDIVDLFLEKSIKINNSKKSEKENFFESYEDLIVNFFYNKKQNSQDTIKLSHANQPQCFSAALNIESSLEPFGFLCITMPSQYKFNELTKNHISTLADSIAFAANMHFKKDALLQANMRYYQQYNEINEELNIYNHNKIEKTILLESKRCERYLTPLSLIFFSIDDLDNFSRIMPKNEFKSLQQDFVNLVKEYLRSTDIFAIYDKNVFAILALNTDYQGAHIVVRKISTIVKKHHFHKISKLTCSFGITSYSIKDNPTLFKTRALSALKKAKDDGGDRWETKILV